MPWKLFGLLFPLASIGDPELKPSSWLLDLHVSKNFFKKSKKIHLFNPIPPDIKVVEKKPSKEDVVEVLLISHVSQSKGVKILVEALSKVARQKSQKNRSH